MVSWGGQEPGSGEAGAGRQVHLCSPLLSSWPATDASHLALSPALSLHQYW